MRNISALVLVLGVGSCISTAQAASLPSLPTFTVPQAPVFTPPAKPVMVTPPKALSATAFFALTKKR